LYLAPEKLNVKHTSLLHLAAKGTLRTSKQIDQAPDKLSLKHTGLFHLAAKGTFRTGKQIGYLIVLST